MIKPVIVRGADFYATFQITSEPYPEGLLIQSSTADSPCVITTQLPHQLETADRVRISGHRKNTIINGKQTVTVNDAFSFSVPVAGAIIGEVSGRVSKAIDITDYDITAKTKRTHGGTEISDTAPTLEIITAADGECSVTLSKVQTPNIVAKSCVIEVTYIDTDNFTRKFSIECEVANA